MKFRTLGRTGLRVSEIGVGGHEYRRQSYVKDGRYTSLDPNRPRLIAKAIELGMNYFDTTFTEEAQSLGHALKEIGADRGSIYISVMSIRPFARLNERPPSEWKHYLESEINERLRLLGTDYVDVFTLGIVEDSFDAVKLKTVLEYLAAFREKGMFRYIGASGHDPQLMSKIIEDFDPFDTVLTRLNFVLDPSRGLLDIARNHNVGVVAMKAFCWDEYGVSFVHVRKQLIERLLPSGPTAAQLAIRWILQSEEVSTVVPGINSMEELIENAGAGDLGAEEVDCTILELLRNYPHVVEGMIELIDHPFEETRHYALAGVKKRIGQDFGTDKQKYREAWKAH